MKNYYNYFTEIEERFQQRRGSILMLSTLDWALVESWREAEVPLAAVLRGIDEAFDKHDAKAARSARRVRQVNGLAWCAQAVLKAAELARDASIGAGGGEQENQKAQRESGFEAARIARYLRGNAALLAAAELLVPASDAAVETAIRLRELAESLEAEATVDAGVVTNLSTSEAANPGANPAANLEELDRSLSVLEEKLLAALLTATPEQQLTALREQTALQLEPYRGKMQAVQIRQVQQQLLQKRLLEAHALPRLSLFYMPHQDDARENASDEDTA